MGADDEYVLKLNQSKKVQNSKKRLEPSFLIMIIIFQLPNGQAIYI